MTLSSHRGIMDGFHETLFPPGQLGNSSSTATILVHKRRKPSINTYWTIHCEMFLILKIELRDLFGMKIILNKRDYMRGLATEVFDQAICELKMTL